jgi:drug/metabolite transporter (DMT)-like permease
MTRRAAFLFAALGLAWGIPYLFIKIAGEELPPATLVLARTAVAALILVPIAVARREVVPALRRWRPLLAYTVAEIVLPWLFLARAERTLPSSTTGLLIAAVPLVGIVIAAVSGRAERIGGRGWLGLCLGTAGVAALVGLDIAGSDLSAVAQVSIVVVGYAVGPAVLSRWLSDVPGLGVVAVSIGAAALAYVPVVLLGPGLPSRLPSGGVIASVVVLAVVCTAGAFVLFFALIAELGPVRATTIVYVNPVVAVVAGAVFLRERVTAWTVVGFALVLVGSFLVTRRSPVSVRPASSAPRPADPAGPDAAPDGLVATGSAAGATLRP